MKKLITLITCVFLLASVNLKAQTRMSDEQRKEAMAKYEDFKTKLNRI